MKKNLLILLAGWSVFALAACGKQKEELSLDVYEAVSKQTMSHLLIFADEEKVKDCYQWKEDLSYYQLKEGKEEQAKELLQEPILWVDLIGERGFGQRIGLTECEEVFAMIRTDDKLFERAVEIVSKEADVTQIREIIQEEYIALGLIEGGK